MILRIVLSTSLVSVLAFPARAQTRADTVFVSGDWATAARLYQEQAARAPLPLGSRVRAGYAGLSTGDVGFARLQFQSIVDAAPANGAPAALAGLSMIAARSGDSAQALALLERAVTAGYAVSSAIERDTAFRRLSSAPRYLAALERARRNAFPCLSDSGAQAFGFWVGDWNVYLTGSERKVGENRIETVSGGCAILEHWTALESVVVPPGNGTSLNFLDPVKGTWRQVWMGSGRGQTDYADGVYRDGIMRFTFSGPDATGVMRPGRFFFHNLGPNRVRQVQELSRDGGTTFVPVYDFTYIRKGSSEPVIRP